MSTVFPELAGILLVWKKYAVKGRDPQFHMQMMDVEVAGRNFTWHQPRSEPRHGWRKWMEEMRWSCAWRGVEGARLALEKDFI